VSVNPRTGSGITTRSTLWGWILAVLMTLFAVAPLAYPGFFEAQSGFLPPLNIEHLAEAPSWGRAAEPARGEGKLPFLLVWPAFALSGSGVGAIKWGYGLAFVLGALGMYAWTRHWLGWRGGVLAATIYTYLPWHLTTVYVRGAYAEAWLWAYWPYVLWALDRWGEGRALVACLVGLPSLAAALWTQPGLTGLSIPVLVAYGVIVAVRKRWTAARVGGAVALALLLLWFAALLAPDAVPAWGDGFLHPFQFLSANQSLGAEASTEGTGLSFQLGVVAVGLSIVAVALCASGGVDTPGETERPAPARLDRTDALRSAVRFWLTVVLGLILLILPVSALLWRFSGFDALLSAPWQLLALAGLPLAFLAGSVVGLEGRLAELPVWAGLVALVVLASYPYVAPRFTQVDPGPEPVALFQPADAAAPQLVLLEAEIEAPTEITPTLSLTLTWQAVDPVSEDYTVFVHVLGEDDQQKVAQQDAHPCDGECPTGSWQPGEIIEDRHRLAIDPGAPAGPYRLAVGLYRLDTGERVAVLGRDDATVYLHVP
jgi:hypothetical protein